MTNFGNLPFEKLLAYQEARKLLEAMREAAISDCRLRDQALRAATSVCLNISEGAGRKASADKARVYAIARGENCEAAAALDIALAAGTCETAPASLPFPFPCPFPFLSLSAPALSEQHWG